MRGVPNLEDHISSGSGRVNESVSAIPCSDFMRSSLLEESRRPRRDNTAKIAVNCKIRETSMTKTSTHKLAQGESPLTPAQLKAVYLIFSGNSIQETAQAIGRSRQTVSQWLNHSHEFKEKIAELQAEDAEEVRFLLASTRGHMLRNLRRLSIEGTEATQLRATQFYLENFLPPSDGMAIRTAEEEAIMRKVLALRPHGEGEED